jgi:hypothetical protein
MKQTTLKNRRNQMQSSGIATCRNAIARIAIVTSLFLISVLATLPEVSRAQPSCPDPTWALYMYDTTLASGCELHIYYCTKTFAGYLETYIEEIDPQNDLCDGIDPQLLICEASELILTDPIVLNNLPPCPTTMMSYQSFSHSCWEYHFRPAGGPQYIPCCDAGVCVESVTVCSNGTAPVLTAHSWSSYGTCPCAPPPTPPIAWTDGTCYTVACGICE